MNHADFISALDSLNPTKMFSANNTNPNDKTDWTNFSQQLQLSKMPYIRCVFSAAGFCREVYYLVNEYNKLQTNKIYLYHLNDVKLKFHKLYLLLHSDISEIKEKPDIGSTITQDEWNLKSKHSKSVIKKEFLQYYCKERRIRFSNETKDVLITKLDGFNLQQALQVLKM